MSKSAVVTGASSGLGKEIALALSKEGYNVLIVGRNKKGLEEVKSIIEKNSQKCFVVTGDLSEKSVQDNVFSEAAKNFKKIDVLVNNAGILIEGPLEETTERDIDYLMQVNTLSHIRLCKLFYQHMKANKSAGKIINIVSTTGIAPKYNQAVYAASKFAMKGFTDSLRFEANRHNIQVFGIYPGGMKTELHKKSGSKTDTSKFMDPAEVASIVVNSTKTFSRTTGDLIIYRMDF